MSKTGRRGRGLALRTAARTVGGDEYPDVWQDRPQRRRNRTRHLQLGANWGEVTDATARATLRAAYEAGTTFSDTADVYGMGRSETFIGEFLKELGPARSSGVFVATKLGRFSPPGWPENFSRAGVRLHTEASLQRLGVERIDLTQLHCVPGDVMERGEIFESLRELQREGKIGAFGASVESMDEAAVCLRQPDLAALQIIFNIFARNRFTRSSRRRKNRTSRSSCGCRWRAVCSAGR